MKESQGSKTASLMKQYKNNVDRPVGAILSLNTIAHTIGSAGVGAESMKLFGEEYFGLISAILTLLILVLSEIIPKTIGASYWRSLAMPSTKIIRVLIFITYPLVLLSELITKVFTPKNHQASVSREEVSAMVDVGTTEGIFRESESKIIKSCIRLAGVKAREVMTPSIVIESANVNLTIKEFLRAADMELLTHSGIRQEQGLCHRLRAEGHGAEGIVRRQVRHQALRPYAPHPFLQRGRFGVSDMGEDAGEARAYLNHP